ncbi:MAG: Periplasmic serine endoprotease DegP [Alphaproteobacteria bacterium MarineAlpha5_Bin11]|nr:serine protease [Pelagibacteraceae bacterium]PPR43727.1 MAG: Periplasmic serine endoprotease DegP [Alphaproteobacteria bacterium MarineAlpha5_Bin11]PPR50507.1 MAG: Periplasmic serine endoprotease DegP [Alphaproteobacteria bacterium MarineAlpha5_Bin10]|tara:strand:+ start:5073 stop:6488 length:1416 start_codon:yes stop_codon:yes gene_type:complete
MKKFSLIVLLIILKTNIIFSKPVPESFANIIDPLMESVVSIASTTIVEEREQNFPQFPEGSPFEEFFKEYFEEQQRNKPSNKRPLIGLGSGFIIDNTGIVVTNNHVIDEADEITVIMENNEEFPATIIGRDPRADIAVIKFDPKDKILKSVNWGDSDSARVGDWAIAIGNPLGFGGSVTAGIISAIARDIGGGPYVKFIQTDASINRGNSGGPLFNVKGEVIGINSAIVSQTGGSIGLGFAIPSNSARKIVSQLREFGKTKRGWLGVQIQGVTDEIAESLDLSNNKGAFVASVLDDSPAFKSGIEAGDVIKKFNNVEINTYRDLPRIVAETDVGTTVNVEIWRKNELITISVKLGELEENTYTSENIETEESPGTKIESLGFEIRDLNKKDFEKYQLAPEEKGILVTEVYNQDSNILVGDIITEINRNVVLNVEELKEEVINIRKTGRTSVLLRVIREGKSIWLTLKFLDN